MRKNGNVFLRTLSLVMVLAMCLGMLPAGVIAADGEPIYIVAGSDALCGVAWDAAAAANQMTLQDGKYVREYKNVPAGTYELKVTDGSWANSWGDNGGNVKVEVPFESHVIVTFDPATTQVSVKVEDPNVFTVAGVLELCGSGWEPADMNNRLTRNSEGKYQKVFANVAPGKYQFKVTDGSWENSWGLDGGSNNYEVQVDSACDVTVFFDPETKLISVAGSGVAGEVAFVVEHIIAVGAGSGSFLNGVAWDPTAQSNKMTEEPAKVYEITYENMAAGAYEFKFAANSSWADSWGGTVEANGQEAEAVYNGSNIIFTVPEDNQDVTVKLDLTGYDHKTKNGAKFTVTWAEHVEKPAVEYYLVGYINGADVNDAKEELKFADGKLKATFSAESYLMVKASDSDKLYMTEGWLGDVTSATMYQNPASGNKLKVPGNVEYEFTLAVNEDGTLTLSYAEVPVEPAVDYYLVGYINGADVNDATDALKFVDGKLKATFSAESYLMVKASDSDKLYMTEGWLGDVTSATLYQNPASGNKLKVPGNVEYEFTLAVNEDGTLTLSYAEPVTEPDPEPVVDYYLVGYINGGDVNDATDALKFVDGKLRMDVTADAYVAVKASNSDTWYMTAGWLGDVTTASLSQNPADANKLKVPAGKQYDLTLVVNEDGTLTLSYVEAPKTQFYLAGYLNGADVNENKDEFKFVNGQLSVTMDQTSYVTLRDADGNTYLTETFCTTNSAVFKQGWGEKMQVPGGIGLTFTLEENADGTVNLSYQTASVDIPDDAQYYLVGYLNGADVADTRDEYKFVDGKLTTKFNQDSYIQIKTDGNILYATQSYCQEASGTMKPGWGEKMWVPGNADLTISLVVNGDGTLTVSYEAARAPLTDDWYLVGYINGRDYGIGADGANLGRYKFKDGLVCTGFGVDSYVAVKNGNGELFMCETYCQSNLTTLKSGWNEKMRVPGNVGVNFFLNVNDDGTLTLNYYAYTIAPTIPAGYNQVMIHFLQPDDWGSNINAWVWDSNGALPGFEMYQTAWPGSLIPKNTDHPGWHDVVLGTKEPQAFNFIFNDGSKQTADLTTGKVTGPTELWVIGDNVYTEAPKQWTHCTAAVHYQLPEQWGTDIKANAQSGGKEIFNGAASATPNLGWFTAKVDVEIGKDLVLSFTDGTHKSGELNVGTVKKNAEYWFDANGNKTVAPRGWIDTNRMVAIPGTFPGKSWDAASNQMSFDPKVGLYAYTFKNVEPGTYYYKIAINGGWDENYGADGVFNGSNITVNVPTKQDVTIWYSDVSHRSVCSVNYDINAVAELSGTGIDGKLRLTDLTLSGQFSAAVTLAAGEYKDITVTFGDHSYTFAPFTLNTSRKIVFSYDAASGIATHSAGFGRVSTGKLFYTTKDLDYKDPFGAVATGQTVTFALETGTDATQVSLAVRGLKAVPMQKDGEAKDGVQRWKCTTTFDSIGEYGYYFAVSNDNNIAFYCDDNYNSHYGKGDYGTGTVRDINNLFPYDLVVYDAAFETPDWMKDAVIYQIFPDRFFDGDESNNQAQTDARGSVDYEFVSDWYMLPENPEASGKPGYPVYAYKGDGEWSNEIYGGDLEGITQRIGYLKALGVNVIYLNPVFSSISNHRYDACDYMQIDPILGTLGDFEELVKIAEENGMKIILDGVFNHVSDDSVYFDRYYKFLGKSEKVGAYPYWAYVYDYMAEKNVSQETAESAARTYFTNEYGITDFSYTEWFVVNNEAGTGKDSIGQRAGKPVYTYEGWWGFDSMPVVKSTDGSEFKTGTWAEEIIGNSNNSAVSQYWISKGNNGWRLDVANEVSDETWKNFRDSVKALDSDAVIVGEIWFDSTHYLLGDMYDSVMNYVFRDAVAGFARGYLINRDNKYEKWDADYTAEDAITTLEILRERYPEEAFYAMMNLVGSHDTSRILSYLDDVEDDRHQKDMGNAFPTYEATSQRAKQLQYVVSFIQFTYAGAPTIYYGDEIGMVGADDPDDRRAFTWGKGNEELVTWYATLAAIRAQYSALRTGSVNAFAPSRDVMGYVRSDDADALVVLANRAAGKSNVTLDLAELGLAEGTYTDLVTGNTYTAANGKLAVSVDAYRGVILTQNVKDITVDTEALAPAYDAEYIIE